MTTKSSDPIPVLIDRYARLSEEYRQNRGDLISKYEAASERLREKSKSALSSAEDEFKAAKQALKQSHQATLKTISASSGKTIQELEGRQNLQKEKLSLDFRLQAAVIMHAKALSLREVPVADGKLIQEQNYYSNQFKLLNDAAGKTMQVQESIMTDLRSSGWIPQRTTAISYLPNSSHPSDPMVGLSSLADDCNRSAGNLRKLLYTPTGQAKTKMSYYGNIAIFIVVAVIGLFAIAIPLIFLAAVLAGGIGVWMSLKRINELNLLVDEFLSAHSSISNYVDHYRSIYELLDGLNQELHLVLNNFPILVSRLDKKGKLSYLYTSSGCKMDSAAVEALRKDPVYSDVFHAKPGTAASLQVPALLFSELEAEATKHRSSSNTKAQRQAEAETASYDSQLSKLNDSYTAEKTRLKAAAASQIAAMDQKHQASLAELDATFNRQKQKLMDDLAELKRNVRDLDSYTPLDAQLWDTISFPLGCIHHPLEGESIDIPVSFSLHKHRPLLICSEDSRGATNALNLVKSTLVRAFCKLPAGKLRCVLYDPGDLGKSFSEFTGLLDIDDRLLYKRVYTEPESLLTLLKELKAEMEKVIQHKLRSHYASVEDIYQEVGAVRDPYVLIVLDDLPVGLNNPSRDGLLRLIQSIIKNGPACGFHCVLNFYGSYESYRNSELSGFVDNPFVISIEKSQIFALDYSRQLGLKPVFANDKTNFSRMYDYLSKGSQNSGISQDLLDLHKLIGFRETDWFSGSSLDGIKIPLGMSPAYQPQFLDVGGGTRQHCLVAGKTGSGKSTLLHTIICNLAIKYHPLELELYLIDFKKGVEFKAYGSNFLPHAPVIAIAGETEYGYSILEYLDHQLELRGKLFRNAGADGYKEYRTKSGKTLPRIMLVADEFQEFFTDTEIESGAKLLFSKLVKQGRAFGIHLLLCTQSLAGTLRPELMNQFSIRIALSCSRDDSMQILDTGNLAAKDLKNPGEAIYNDDGGHPEANHHFQTTWIKDDLKTQILGKIRGRLESDPALADRKRYIFEGNGFPDFFGVHSPAELDDLRSSGTMRMDLGTPTVIGSPLYLELDCSRRNNLLAVCRDQAISQGLLGTMLATACLRQAWNREIFLLDYSPADSPLAELAGTLSKARSNDFHYGRSESVNGFISAVHQELQTRMKAAREVVPSQSILLVLNQLQRIRDLDAGLMRFGISAQEKETPEYILNNQLHEILQHGPELNIFCIVFVDMNPNISRRFPAAQRKEFGHLICFNMTRNDSVELLNSHDAEGLGAFKAIYLNDLDIRQVKFIPYQMPDPALLSSYFISQTIADPKAKSPKKTRPKHERERPT